MLFFWSRFALLFSPKSKVLLVFFIISLIIKIRLDLESRVQVTVCDVAVTSQLSGGRVWWRMWMRVVCSSKSCLTWWRSLDLSLDNKLYLWVSVKITRPWLRTLLHIRTFSTVNVWWEHAGREGCFGVRDSWREIRDTGETWDSHLRISPSGL